MREIAVSCSRSCHVALVVRAPEVIVILCSALGSPVGWHCAAISEVIQLSLILLFSATYQGSLANSLYLGFRPRTDEAIAGCEGAGFGGKSPLVRPFLLWRSRCSLKRQSDRFDEKVAAPMNQPLQQPFGL